MGFSAGIEFISLPELVVVIVKATVLIVKSVVTVVNLTELGLCTEGDIS